MPGRQKNTLSLDRMGQHDLKLAATSREKQPLNLRPCCPSNQSALSFAILLSVFKPSSNDDKPAEFVQPVALPSGLALPFLRVTKRLPASSRGHTVACRRVQCWA